jgi:L-asparaginase
MLVEGHVHRIASVRKPRTHVPRRRIDALVPVVAPAVGEGADLLEAVGPIVDGLVVMGMGGGHVPATMVGALHEIARRVPVVLAGRPHGMSLACTYRSAGSEGDLLARGLMRAGVLSAWQSRILLLVGLACDYGREGLAAAFADAGAP